MALLDDERPKVVEIVSWAAKNGDRSENGDYLYGKKRLREIDRRIRFLTKRLDIAEVVDPSLHHGNEQVFFGATVRYANDRGEERTMRIMGIDEAESAQGEVSWISPIARALLKARVGDEVRLMTPGGPEALEILAVSYPAPPGWAEPQSRSFPGLSRPCGSKRGLIATTAGSSAPWLPSSRMKTCGLLIVTPWSRWICMISSSRASVRVADELQAAAVDGAVAGAQELEVHQHFAGRARARAPWPARGGAAGRTRSGCR